MQPLTLGDGAGDLAPILFDEGLAGGSVSRGVYTLFFAPGVIQEALLAMQLPHGYLAGSDLKPHIHWSPSDDNTGDVVWGVEYTFINASAVFPDTTSLEATDTCDGGLKHQIVNLGTIPGIGSSNDTSSMLLARVYRKGDDANDTYSGAAALLEFDIHYQSNRAGTVAEFGPN